MNLFRCLGRSVIFTRAAVVETKLVFGHFYPHNPSLPLSSPLIILFPHWMTQWKRKQKGVEVLKL